MHSPGALFAVLLLADVMPHCGGPKVDVQDPGQSCGHHGPRWRGDCRPPAACFDTTAYGSVCTAVCEQDADCGSLGADFTCSASEAPYTSSEPKRMLCGRTPKQL